MKFGTKTEGALKFALEKGFPKEDLQQLVVLVLMDLHKVTLSIMDMSKHLGKTPVEVNDATYNCIFIF